MTMFQEYIPLTVLFSLIFVETCPISLIIAEQLDQVPCQVFDRRTYKRVNYK
jgi:hypothetical protein